MRSITPFGCAALLGFVVVPVGAPVDWPVYAVASALAVAILVATLTLPWHRLPHDARVALPLAFLVSAALLRHSGGGANGGVGMLVLLPVFWIALHGTRRQLGLVLAGVGAFFAVPVLLVGGATYPTAGLRSAVMSMVVTGIVGAAVQQLTRTLREQADTLREREAELETAAAAREHALAQVERLARSDPLTELGNRRAWTSGCRRRCASPCATAPT